MEFLEALCRAIDTCKKLPINDKIHQHWYLAEVPFDKWSLDMKLEAMVPSIIDALHGKCMPGLSTGDFGTILPMRPEQMRKTVPTVDMSQLKAVRTNVTAHIGTVVNVDLNLSNYK